MFEAGYSKIDSFVFFVLYDVLTNLLALGGARLLTRAGYNSFFKFLLMLVCRDIMVEDWSDSWAGEFGVKATTRFGLAF